MLLNRAKESGASYIIPMFGLTLRKVSREYFYRALEKYFSGIKEKYQSSFKEKYECFSPNYKMLNDTFHELAEKLGISTRMKFYEPFVYKQQSIF